MPVEELPVGPVASRPLSAVPDWRHVDAGPKISVVIPTLNEAANLPHVFDAPPASVDEVVLVDGHSIDDTIAVARALRPDVRIVLQDGRGKGNALACGFAAAHGDIIVMLDADGSTDPAEIPRFVDALLAGARLRQGLALRRRRRQRRHHARCAGSATASSAPLVNVLFGTRYTDLCYGYNAFWRHCLPHMHVACDGFEVETLINIRVARAGLAVAEVPSIEHERLHGESNLNAVRDGLRVLRTIVARARAPPARPEQPGRLAPRASASWRRRSAPSSSTRTRRLPSRSPSRSASGGGSVGSAMGRSVLVGRRRRRAGDQRVLAQHPHADPFARARAGRAASPRRPAARCRRRA